MTRRVGKFSGVIVHPCMRKYRVGMFSALNQLMRLDVIESAAPSSGGFVANEREQSVLECDARFLPRSKYRIPLLSNSNLSIFRCLDARYRFVVFSSFLSLPFLLLSFPAKLLGKKVFVFDEIWSYPGTFRHQLLKYLYKFVAKFTVSGFILASSRAKQFNESFFGPNFRRVVALNTHSNYEGVDADSFGKKADSLLFLGRVVEIKGLDILIRALALTDKNLVVYGEGGELHSCKLLADKLGLSDRVRFNGGCERKDVDAIMRSYRYFVLPSRPLKKQVESWGFTVNEALLQGCKVVVSDSVGSAQDLIFEGWNGYVFKSDDYKDLADKLNKLPDLKASPAKISERLRSQCSNKGNAMAVYSMISSVLGDDFDSFV